MDRVVMLTVDEVSVLIGLLDEGWSDRHAVRSEQLGEMAQRYIDLLWSRVVDVELEGVGG